MNRTLRRRCGRVAAAVLLTATASLAACSSGSPDSGSPGSGSASSGSADRTVASPAEVVGASGQDSVVGPVAVVHPADWPMYHRNIYRTGEAKYVTPVSSALTKVWDVKLDGAVYASPITAVGVKILVTENNTMYRVANNHVVWARHLGAPVPGSALPCGNIDPSGITGTPIYDSHTSTVVAVALLNNPIRHVAFGLEPVTGQIRWQRTVDVPGSEPGIDPKAMQQRGALLAVGGHLYIPYGGLAGDCSSYRGSVVDLDLNHPVSGALSHYTIPTSREAGIWATPGLGGAPAGGVLLSAGNGATASTGTYDYSDSVIRLVGNKRADSFSPSTWREDNAADLDLGSQGPTTVAKWVFIAGKRGVAYVLDGAHLGGIGGQVSQLNLCPSFGGTAASGTTVYVPCTDGIRAVQIRSTGTMTVRWHAPSAVSGSPVLGAGRLWSLDTANGVLYALDPATGLVRGHWPVGAVSRFATPVVWHSQVFVGTLSGVVSYSWT
ncbi:MAG: hypothetical protein ABJA87_04795 [bacterium]